jgi:hypothetical protein
MATKTKKTRYTVRLEWDVTYFLDVTGVKASTPEEAAEIAMEDPDYDNQESYDDAGDTHVARVTEDATGIRHDMKPAATGEDNPDKKCEATFAGLALVKWCAEDIQTLRPDWDAAKCNEFLYENEDEIQLQMIDTGWKVIKHRPGQL